MADCPFILIEFPQFDVAVPLVCRLCGSCCRNYYVPVEPESLPEVARIMGETIHAIQERLNERLEDSRRGRPSDCCFLAEGRCLIHEVRPEACRQFPSFTDAAAGNADCPAHKEHKRIEKTFCREYQNFRIRLPSSSRAPRRLPDGLRQELLGIVERAGASEKFRDVFLSINKEAGET